MDLFGSSYYKHLLRASSLAGVWPYEETTYSRFRRICILIVLLHYLLLAILPIIMMNVDLDVIVQTIPVAIAFVISIVKYTGMWMKVGVLRNLLDRMKTDWETVNSMEELCILRKYAEHARLIAKLYAIFLCLVIVSVAIIQFSWDILDIVVPLNESRPRSFIFEFAHFIDPDKYYYIIALHTISAGSVCFFCMGVADLLFAIIMVHACGACQVLGYRFDRIYRNFKPHECNNKIKCNFRREVEQCIYKHQMLKRFTDHINQTYAASFTIQVAWAGIAWISTLSYFFKEFMIQRFSDAVIKYAIYFLAYTLTGMFLTFLSQILRNNSMDLNSRIIIGKWNEACRPTQKLLIFLMQHSAEVLTVYFGHGIGVSSEIFIDGVKILGSYMMALFSLYNEEV